MDTLELLAKSQAGDEDATNKLLSIIKKEHMNSKIRRFVQRNVLIGKDEIESEFLIGCWEALKIAKPDVGNFIHFVCWKGQLKVLALFRKQLKEGVRVNCSTCGVGSLTYSAARKTALCSKCGATDVTTFMVVTDETQHEPGGDFGDMNDPTPTWDKMNPSEVLDHNEQQFDEITHGIRVEEIRSKLTGRTQQLFDKMILEGINRETSNNYLEEIANDWGITTACVSVYLRKLRQKMATMELAAA